MTAPRLGRVQLQIMQVLWQRGRASARQITEDLNEIDPIAHSTVQTLLRKMENKRAVAHDVDERTFIYYPLVQEGKVTKSATRDLVDRVFGGSAAGLVAYLLKHERISRKEMDQIRKVIDDQ